jgi:hypothetical protein
MWAVAAYHRATSAPRRIEAETYHVLLTVVRREQCDITPGDMRLLYEADKRVRDRA